MVNIEKKNINKKKNKNKQLENDKIESIKNDTSDGQIITWKEIRKSDGKEAIMMLTLKMTI